MLPTASRFQSFSSYLCVKRVPRLDKERVLCPIPCVHLLNSLCLLMMVMAIIICIRFHSAQDEAGGLDTYLLADQGNEKRT